MDYGLSDKMDYENCQFVSNFFIFVSSSFQNSLQIVSNLGEISFKYYNESYC